MGSKTVAVEKDVELTMSLGDLLSLDSCGRIVTDGANSCPIAKLPSVLLDLTPNTDGEDNADEEYDYSEIYVQSVSIVRYENEFPVGLYWSKEDFRKCFDPASVTPTSTNEPHGDNRSAGRIFDDLPVYKFESELCKKFLDTDTTDTTGTADTGSAYDKVGRVMFPVSLHFSRDLASLHTVLTFCGCDPKSIYSGCLGFRFPSYRVSDGPDWTPETVEDVEGFLSAREDEAWDPLKERWVIWRGDHALAEMAIYYADNIRSNTRNPELPFPDSSIFLFEDFGPPPDDGSIIGGRPNPKKFIRYKYVHEDSTISSSCSPTTTTTTTGSSPTVAPSSYRKTDGKCKIFDARANTYEIYDGVLANGKVAKCLFDLALREVIPSVRRGASDGRRMQFQLSFFKTSVSLKRYRKFVPTLEPPSPTNGGDENWVGGKESLGKFEREVYCKKLSFRATLGIRFVVFKKKKIIDNDGDGDAVAIGGKRPFCATARL